MLKNVKVLEGQDATFECVLSGPVPKLTWCANDVSIEHGGKHNITVSEDMTTHRLVIKKCQPEDKGIYTVIAGIKFSKASLTVEGKFDVLIYQLISTQTVKTLEVYNTMYVQHLDDPNAHGKGQSGAGNADNLTGQLAAKGQAETNTGARATGGNYSGQSGFDGSGGEGLGRDGLGADGHDGDRIATDASLADKFEDGAGKGVYCPRPRLQYQ